MNINNNVGSTHIEGLHKLVVEMGLDIGFAYDGDADRCLCVGNLNIPRSKDHQSGRAVLRVRDKGTAFPPNDTAGSDWMRGKEFPHIKRP